MEKKIYAVLAVDKKTGKVEKDLNVVAEDTTDAELKAFDVDKDNLHITTTEVGKLSVTEPVQAVIVKEEKK